MPDVTDLTDHKPYIAAVAAALRSAGISVADFFADTNDAREGAVTLDRPDDPKAITWSEDRGWISGDCNEDGSMSNLRQADALDIVASPAEVVFWVQNGARGSRDIVLYRDVYGEDGEDGEDEELAEIERALAAYLPEARRG